MTLEEMIAALEKQSMSTATIERHEQKTEKAHQEDKFISLMDRALALKETYRRVKEEHDQAMIELLTYMRQHGIKSRIHAGYKFTASDSMSVEYTVDLHEKLKPLLSEEQWLECFEPQPPKIKKRGINKFLKMGGLVSQVILENQVVKELNPRPSDLKIEKLEEDE